MLTIYISWKSIANVFKCFSCYPSYSFSTFFWGTLDKSSTFFWGTLDKSYRNHKKSIIKISQVHILEIIRSGNRLQNQELVTGNTGLWWDCMSAEEMWRPIIRLTATSSLLMANCGSSTPLLAFIQRSHAMEVTLLWHYCGAFEDHMNHV